MIVSEMVFLMLAGAVATTWGYYVISCSFLSGIFHTDSRIFQAPYIIAGTMICTVGCGLLTTISLNTPIVIWATFEVLIGMGLGGSLQLPYTVSIAQPLT